MAEQTTRIYELQVKLAQESLAQLKKLEGATKGIETQFKAAGSAVKDFGVGLVSAFSVGAIIATVQQAISVVDELGAAAQRVGVGVEQFSALAFAAEQSDMAMADLEIALKELQKSMVETGTKGANVLDALGIDKTKPQVEVLKDFADAFQTIHDPALRTNALLEVFGKSGLKLRPLLEQGAIGIDELMQKAKELGIVIDEETAESFSNLDNQLKQASKQAQGLARNMTEGLTPALSDVLTGFTDAAKGGDAFKTVGEGLGVVVRVLAGVANLAALAFKQTGTMIAGVAAAISKVIAGDFDEVATVGELMRAEMRKNADQFAESEARILGLAPAIEKVTGATDKNTRSVTNNDAAIRTALTTQEKDKKAKAERTTAIEKLTKALDDQIFKLEQVGQEDTEMARALRAVMQVIGELTPIEQARALALVAQVGALEQLNKKEKERADTMKQIDDIVKSHRDEQEKLNDDIREYELLIEKAPEREAELQEAIRRRYAQYFESIKPIQPVVDETTKMLEKLADKIDGYAKSISDTFVDFVTGANDAKFSFSEFATSVLRDLLKMATQMLIMEPLIANFKKMLMSSGGSGGGGGFLEMIGKMFAGGMAAQAKGGVYASPSLSAYSGGVYDKPKLFAFAGGAGVFAEAGPEAIMPLKRGAGGTLGVDASGAGGDVTVNVINQAGADVDVKSSRSANGEREITVMIQQAVADGFARGRFDGVMGSTYGVNRRGR